MCHSAWQGDFTCACKQVVNRLKTPMVSPHFCFIGGVKVPQGQGSSMIHRKKNDQVYKDATCLCHILWQCDFTCEASFSSECCSSWLFGRPASTKLFFLVHLLLLALSSAPLFLECFFVGLLFHFEWFFWGAFSLAFLCSAIVVLFLWARRGAPVS